MTENITQVIEIVATSCGVCGIQFGLDRAFYKQRHADGKVFYCPNGHTIGWGEGEANKLRAEKLELESRLKFTQNRLETVKSERDQEIKKVTIQKGRATRFKNDRNRIMARIANGVCPCCCRHFVNVERHMKGQHPNYVIPESVEE